jgi:hypothetical protein
MNPCGEARMITVVDRAVQEIIDFGLVPKQHSALTSRSISHQASEKIAVLMYVSTKHGQERYAAAGICRPHKQWH